MDNLRQKLSVMSIVSLFLCLGISGCTQQGAYSSIVESPCAPPCWYGITPGLTSSQEAITALGDIPLVDSTSIETQAARQYHFENQIFWDFLNQGYGGLSLKNDIVMEIRLEDVSIPLEKLVDVFGDPEQMVFYPRWGDDWYVNLLYPQQGIWLWYHKHQISPGNLKIQARDSVKRITFVDPGVLFELLAADGRLYLEEKSLTISEVLIPWQGYGNIEIP